MANASFTEPALVSYASTSPPRLSARILGASDLPDSSHPSWCRQIKRLRIRLPFPFRCCALCYVRPSSSGPQRQAHGCGPWICPARSHGLWVVVVKLAQRPRLTRRGRLWRASGASDKLVRGGARARASRCNAGCVFARHEHSFLAVTPWRSLSLSFPAGRIIDDQPPRCLCGRRRLIREDMCMIGLLHGDGRLAVHRTTR
jgi:hypothetical protein